MKAHRLSIRSIALGVCLTLLPTVLLAQTDVGEKTATAAPICETVPAATKQDTRIDAGRTPSLSQEGANDPVFTTRKEVTEGGAAKDLRASNAEARTNTGPASHVEWLGQRYLLGRHQMMGNTINDEYFLENEGPENWSQLLAVQKIEQTHPAVVLNQLRNARNVRCEVLAENSISCVLRVKEAGVPTEAREGVILIQRNASPETGLAVVTYLLKPARVEASTASLQLEAWKERLLAQARSLTRAEENRVRTNP